MANTETEREHEETIMTSICYEHNNFGTVKIDDGYYELIDEAQLSDRAFPGSFQNAEDGEEYISEWECRGYERGTHLSVRVVWHFLEIKGRETEPENLDWDNVRFVHYV